MSGLKCGVPGCNTVIRAMTGLQELQKLRQHMRRAHAVNYNMTDALELRLHYEDKQEQEGQQGD